VVSIAIGPQDQEQQPQEHHQQRGLGCTGLGTGIRGVGCSIPLAGMQVDDRLREDAQQHMRLVMLLGE
jgi:hypothetical protein